MTQKQLAEFVLKKRNEQGISQQELAKRIGRLRQTIFHMENNLVDFGVSSFLDVVSALGYEIVLVKKDNDYKFDFSKIKILFSENHTFKKSKIKRK